VIEERCPPAVSANAPVCESTPVSCPQAAAPQRSLFHKCCPSLCKEKAPEIHVTVPAPNVVVRREEKCVERTPAAARAPKPGNEVMLVPTTVYVPYQRMTPTGTAQMVPLNMVPGQPVAAPPPCTSPTSAPCPTAAPPCPTGATCPPGATNCPNPSGSSMNLPPIPSPTVTTQTTPNIDDLNRRCNNLENKIDNLIDALSKSRAGGR
jgi:hypothetical protein